MIRKTLLVTLLFGIISGCATTRPVEDMSINQIMERYDKYCNYGCALKIKDGTPFIGMNKNMLIDAMGRPSDINKTTTKNGTSEQWVYRIGYDATYVYFEDGKVDAIQN